MTLQERLAYGKILITRGLFHAALHVLLEILEDIQPMYQRLNASVISELYNEIGKLHILLSNYRGAVDMFAAAVENAPDLEHRVRYTINLASAYGRLSEFDTAYRYLIPLVNHVNKLPSRVRGHLLVNLSTLHGINGYHRQVIECAGEALARLHAEDIHVFDEALLNNLGVAHLELGDYDAAERYFHEAVSISGPALHHVAELGRISIYRGDIQMSLHYAEAALRGVWSVLVDYEKEELARLCQLLAMIAAVMSETNLALRLAEKAQVLFGQLGMWRQWQSIDADMRIWLDSSQRVSAREPRFTELFRQFLHCLDAIYAQELLGPDMSRVLDVRAHYVRLLAGRLGVPPKDQSSLVLAARLVDYGLTALEPEVISHPRRSPHSWARYQQHPQLGVQMLRALDLPATVEAIVSDHHEHYDGSGYPVGKKGAQIHYLARILSVADAYAALLIFDGKNHSQAIDTIKRQRGAALDPEIVDAFVDMFTLEKS
jgi:tetratricopeptide (TPR) repeat protein